ncbi:MAG TPA: hypothetical protein DCZ94_11835 [Lentisphaeria bacterium]|nr:MAG: hypothetical protein A2X48_09565 [Lentisphaerae bacterium GWF2_49_21]HBC87638.1 hypothetical protein [Lentisphaeria bacterium]
MHKIILLLSIVLYGCGKPSTEQSKSDLSNSSGGNNSRQELHVAELAQKLSDKDPRVRYRAAEALSMLGEKCAPALPQLMDHIDDEEWARFDNEGGAVRLMVDRALFQIKDGVEPLLISSLESPNPVRRRNAASLLALRKDPSAIKSLIKLLKDPDRLVRANAAEGLGYFHLPETALPIAGLLKDEDWFVRMKAASALALAKSSIVVPQLMEALKDQEENVRCAAAESLGFIGDVRPIEVLSMLAETDKSKDVRNAAADALKRIKDSQENLNKINLEGVKARHKNQG